MTNGSVAVMGVSGSGKTTVGRLLAQRLGMRFIDGDDLHPEVNKEKMAAGIALDDSDRAPWLDAVAAALAHAPGVVACSALKRRYRERLRGGIPNLKFVYLTGSPILLARRLGARSHEFMPPALLESQLAALEPPGPDEDAFTCDIKSSPEAIVKLAAAWLQPGAAEWLQPGKVE